MAALPLCQTVDASVRKHSWRSSVLSLVTSTLLQGGVIAALVVFPLVAMQTPPLPHNVESFQRFVPVVPAPPPPPRKDEGARRPPTAIDPSKLLGEVWRAPAEPFDGILEEVDIFGEAFDGAFDGVEGGVVGAPSAQPIVTLREPEEKAPSGPVEIGGNIRPPRKIHHVNPVYPRVAILAHVQGDVEVRAIIDESGNVVNLAIVKSPSPLLNKAALDAVQQWRYEPTYLNDTPVPIVMTVTVTFRLNR